METPNTTSINQRLGETKFVSDPRNDPINILSFEMWRAMNKFILAFQSCVMVIGLSTNVVNSVVFWRQGLRDRMNLCLFCLSLADLGYLVVILLTLTVSSIMTQTEFRLAKEYSIKSTVYGLGFIFGTAALSRLISMVIAVERCLCVVFPLQARSLIKTRTMASILTAIFIFVFLCYSTLSVGKEITCVRDNGTGQVICLSTVSLLYRQNYLIWQVIYNIIPRVVVPAGTFLIIVVATFITVVRLRAAMSWRQQTSSSSSESQGQQIVLTKMLVVISCIDITCSTPSVIQAMLEIFRPDFLTGGPLYNLVRTTGSLSTVFICINSSVNFFVYFARSSRYRFELKMLWCSKSLTEGEQLTVSTSKEKRLVTEETQRL